MTDGCRWRYTLRDPETGAVVAEGTSVELTKQGYFRTLTEVSYLWGQQKEDRPRKPLKWRIERISAKEWRRQQAAAEGLTLDERLTKREVRVYRCYDAAGELIGQGTAQELVEKGLFGCDGTVREYYRKRGGVYKPSGIARMEMELETRMIRCPKQLPETAKKAKKKKIGGVENPSPLAYDVHDLIGYNETAKKAGKPELSYGYWALKGKPATV